MDKVFTDEFINLINKAKLAILSHEEVHTNGSISNDDFKRLKSYVSDLDSEVREVLNIIEEATKVYGSNEKNTLEPIAESGATRM